MVVLTGATATAKLLMTLRPGLDLVAETGGKNALNVTAMADRDLPIKYRAICIWIFRSKMQCMQLANSRRGSL